MNIVSLDAGTVAHVQSYNASSIVVSRLIIVNPIKVVNFSHFIPSNNNKKEEGMNRTNEHNGHSDEQQLFVLLRVHPPIVQVSTDILVARLVGRKGKVSSLLEFKYFPATHIPND